MKKLMFATALGVSAAAFAIGQAEPSALNATSFEGYTAGQPYLSDKGDIGENGGPKYFCYTDGDSDGSSVKAFGVGDNLTAPSITRPFYFQGATPNANYLELSTEGGILWRSINTISGSAGAYDLGTAQEIASDGIYLDTLVQFTPTEDGGDPTLEAGVDKLAIWLNVDSNQQTNLMVRASYVEDPGNVTCTPTNYTVSCGKDILAGQWYRLTVKALPDVTKAGGANAILGFQIYVDGDLVETSMIPFASSYISTATDNDWGWINDETTVPLLQSGTVFPSILGKSAYSTLQGVGFKGSGAIDDLVWTEEDPFANAGGDAAWIATVTQIFDGANLDAAEKAKITAWASENSIDVDTTVQGQAEIAAAAYLLNMTILPTALPELTITSIEEGADAWTLTVAASVGESAVALPAQINGVVTLTQAGTLAGLATATPATATFAIANGTATVTVAKDTDTAKFMKVGVGIAPAANSGD